MAEHLRARLGDCVINIAKERGFFWETIWNLPENQELKTKRKDPNILKVGDTVYVPDLRGKYASKPTEAEHVFIRKGQKANFTLTLMNLGQPRRNEDYTLVVEGVIKVGRTDEDGTLKAYIPPEARFGLLYLGEKREQIKINFGYVDPIDEVRGVKTRLRNLGFFSGPIDDETNDELATAVAQFQRSLDLAGNGEVSDETRQKLKETHGS